MKVKLSDLNKKEVHEAIHALEGINLKAKASYKVGKFARLVKKEMDELQDEIGKISNRFNEENPAIKDKELLREEGMSNDELLIKHSEFMEKINAGFSDEVRELLDMEVEIAVSQLTLDEIGEKEVPTTVFEWLPFFIVDVLDVENKE